LLDPVERGQVVEARRFTALDLSPAAPALALALGARDER
jgi:hypothetical protein